MKKAVVFLAIIFTMGTAGFAQTVFHHEVQKTQQGGKKEKKHAKASKEKGKYDKHKHKKKHKHMHHKKK